MLSFGQRLKLIRKEAQITQSELAEQLMVTVQAVSKWECDNTMPDISLIVPLAAILGVTTDCLLGVGTDEKADTKALYDEVDKIWDTFNPWHYENNSHYKSYELYREHIKKYPLDYETKLRCARSIVGFIHVSGGGARFTIPKEEEDRLYNEAHRLLTSILSYDRDPLRLLESRELLIYSYINKEDFEKAIAVAEELPDKYNIRDRVLMEIYAKQNDLEKCLELSKTMCDTEIEHYLECMWERARRISIFGNARKDEAISAWNDLLEAAKFNYKFKDTGDWMELSLTMLSNDYIAISEIDKAFEMIYQFTDLVIARYHQYKDRGDSEEDLEDYKRDTNNMLFKCYSRCFPTSDNIIANDPRYKACEAKIAAALN